MKIPAYITQHIRIQAHPNIKKKAGNLENTGTYSFINSEEVKKAKETTVLKVSSIANLLLCVIGKTSSQSISRSSKNNNGMYTCKQEC